MQHLALVSGLLLLSRPTFGFVQSFHSSSRWNCLSSPYSIETKITCRCVMRERVQNAGIDNDDIIEMKKMKRKSFKNKALKVATALVLSNASPLIAAATVESSEHLHIGQKIASFFQSTGLPDVVVLGIISALPVVELRGAVPVGLWMGLPISTVLPACVFGNMVPIIPILLILRNEKLKKMMKPILTRAEKKSASLGVGSIEKQWASLAAFVGIPLPGTGAWTGAMGAFLLGMPTPVALSSIFTGVVMAGIIVSAITMAGKKGGIFALLILALITGKEFFGSSSSRKPNGVEP